MRSFRFVLCPHGVAFQVPLQSCRRSASTIQTVDVGCAAFLRDVACQHMLIQYTVRDFTLKWKLPLRWYKSESISRGMLG